MLELLALASTGIPLAALCLYERFQESRQILKAALAGDADESALFDLPPGATRVPPEDPPGLSPDRRRTLRQAETLAAGRHPLGLYLRRSLKLHPDAAPADDRRADGLRCGGCAFKFTSWGHLNCGYGDGVRSSHGPATDIRAWWPACVDYQPVSDERSYGAERRPR